MKQQDYFKHAKWIGAENRTTDGFSIVRGRFSVRDVQTAQLRVLGLGFFQCAVNGHCINPDTFLPLSSDYEAGHDPKGELLTGHRIYVPEFDVTPFITEGDNTIEIRFGGGWYCHRNRPFGLPKAIYLLTVQTGAGLVEFGSDTHCQVSADCIADYCFTAYEHHDLTAERCWQPAVVTEQLETEYCSTDCPADRCIAQRAVTPVGQVEGGIIYDCGENTTGYPVLRLRAPKGERVRVVFAEALTPDGKLDPRHIHGQEFSVISDGETELVQPAFTWFGFRYFALYGDAEPVAVKVIYADVPVSSTFACDNETLNWVYNTFLHTMLCNLHTGHPSDCPHLERRGYTGDGQLTCHAVLSTLDAGNLYRKWLQDIIDGQDQLSGHIQYTAPYIYSGGGPGGWGCAIVEVPYQLYRHTGDSAVLEQCYPNMRRYLDYMEAHSEFGLVTSDQPGAWCLGDWCGPNILYPEKDITAHNQQMILPAAMVNTYFLVKSLEKMVKIAGVIGRQEDIPAYEAAIDQRKRAIRSAYYNAFDHNFLMNVQGANAFGLDIGLGGEKTYPNMANYYRKLGCYDTGIFATDVVTRLFFERGDAELAVALLTGDGPQGFAHWRANGATTFHEYWDSNRSRSHSHPMFGAPVAYLFSHLLGIGQPDDSAGYRSLIIAPQAVECFGWMRGSMQIPAGEVAVAYEKADGGVRFTVTVPAGVEACFRWNGVEQPLSAGENILFAQV